MIGYITLGADDMALAERFYSAFLPRLGYVLEIVHGELSYAMPAPRNLYGDRRLISPDLYVKHPWDGSAASSGNGAMVAFEVPTQAMVRALHAAAVSAGGRDEGAPGFRADYGAQFFVGYLRDPQGNKIALYCDSKDEPARPD